MCRNKGEKIRKKIFTLKNFSILNTEHRKEKKDENCRRYHKQNLYKKQMKSFGWKEQNKGNINLLQCGEYYKEEIVNFV